MSLIRRLWHKRLVRFTTGGVLNMLNRLLLAFLLQGTGLPVWLNYAAIHVFTFFFGYVYHNLVTFRLKMSFAGLSRFLLSVILLRITDYVLVVGSNNLEFVKILVYGIPEVGSYLADNLYIASILFVSLTMFIIRYTLFRKVTFSGGGAVKSAAIE